MHKAGSQSHSTSIFSFELPRRNSRVRNPLQSLSAILHKHTNSKCSINLYLLQVSSVRTALIHSFRHSLCTCHDSVTDCIAHLAVHNAKHNSSSSSQALLNLALISCELSEMDHPEEATAALLAGAMAAGNTGADWGAAATGVPASIHPMSSVLHQSTWHVHSSNRTASDCCVGRPLM